MLLRVAGKLINKHRIHQQIDIILEMRIQGMSQQETAKAVGVDRTFISRLENIGEIRKGEKIAIIGFPILNCEEIYNLARQEGVDYCLVLSEKERWEFLDRKSGAELFNAIMDIITILRQHDVVIMVGSNMRIKLLETLLDNKVIGVQIGESPIEEDKFVNIDDIRRLIRQINSLTRSDL